MKRLFILFVFLLLPAFAPSAVTSVQDSADLTLQSAQQQSKTSHFTTVSPAEAKQLIETRKDILLVDIREPDELKEGAIAGSELIPLLDIVKGRREVPQDKPILLICAVGGRSLALGKLMSKYGWPEIYNLRGGISAWKKAGLPVIY